MPSRKSYTAAFKLEVLQYAKENGNRPLATIAKTIPSSLAELFNSDTEDEEFDGFSDVDDQ